MRFGHRTAVCSVVFLCVLHHLDQWLRADYGWQLAGLTAYPLLVVAALPRLRPPALRAAALAAALIGFQCEAMFLDPPAERYTGWAERSAVLATAAAAVAILLPLVTGVWLLMQQRGRRRHVVIGLLALIVLVDAAYAWAVVSTETSPLARTIAWRGSDVLDYRRFPARIIHARPPAYEFPSQPSPMPTIPVQIHGRNVEQNVDRFLDHTDTTAFLVIKDDTIRYEHYFNGYRPDSTVASFSVAKAFVSAMVGIAIADGDVHSIDDPVTRYLPELARRDERFAQITVRHLLTMSSGLRDLDPYYSVDLRRDALEHTEITEPPGDRFAYNNINPALLGLVLERATGRPVCEYLEEKLWQPLGMEADGLWNLDSERSGFEQMQTGLGGHARDFAKFGALYLHQGTWHGRQLIARDWVAESTRVDTGTDPAPNFQYNWWTRPGTDDFWTQGNHGQFIYVAPSQHIVIVRFGIDYNYDHWPDTLAALARRI